MYVCIINSMRLKVSEREYAMCGVCSTHIEVKTNSMDDIWAEHTWLLVEFFFTVVRKMIKLSALTTFSGHMGTSDKYAEPSSAISTIPMVEHVRCRCENEPNWSNKSRWSFMRELFSASKRTRSSPSLQRNMHFAENSWINLPQNSGQTSYGKSPKFNCSIYVHNP